MPSIPVSTSLGYLGVFFLLFGIFLILAGLNVIKIEKVTVAAGGKTLGFGIILVLFGFVFLLPDISVALPKNPSVSPTMISPNVQTQTEFPSSPTKLVSQVSTDFATPEEAIRSYFLLLNSGVYNRDYQDLWYDLALAERSQNNATLHNRKRQSLSDFGLDQSQHRRIRATCRAI